MARYDSPGHADPLPGVPGYTREGAMSAPGSAGDLASQTEGPVIGSPVVSVPFASSQVAANMPHLDVLAGDSSAMSSDQAVGDAFVAISGADPAPMSDTGAGHGSPNAPSRPWRS